MTLQRAILVALTNQHPTPVPETAVIADVNLMLPETVTPSIVRRELQLLDPIFIVSSDHPDRGRLYSLTARGLHRLQS